MSAESAPSQQGGVMPAPDMQVLEQIYSVPLERPLERDLFVVMAALLAHVLHVDNLNQPGSGRE